MIITQLKNVFNNIVLTEGEQNGDTVTITCPVCGEQHTHYFVENGDTRFCTRVPIVNKKTAYRIWLEMPIAYGRPIPPKNFYKFNRRTVYAHGWQFLVEGCPFCGKDHLHGWDPANLPDDPGQTRLSHCSGGNIYRLVVKGGKNDR